MWLVDRYDFTNNAAFEVLVLNQKDTERLQVPDCDVIAFRRVQPDGTEATTIMRPDEALIQAQLLIRAVRKATSGYEIELQPGDPKVVQDVQM